VNHVGGHPGLVLVAAVDDDKPSRRSEQEPHVVLEDLVLDEVIHNVEDITRSAVCPSYSSSKRKSLAPSPAKNSLHRATAVWLTSKPR
jgi:hypothetical protein